MRISRYNKGFTVAELIMSLVVMSLLATAVAGLSIALTDSYEHGKNFQEDMQIARNSLRNISNLIKNGNLICGGNATSLVIWNEDVDSDGYIDVRELTYIELDSQTGKVCQYYLEYPDEYWASILDPTATLAQANDIDLIGSYIKASHWKQTHTLAQNANSLSFGFDRNPPLSQVAQMKVRIGSDINSSVTMRSSAWIRSDWINLVGTVNGQWELAGGGI